MPQDPTTHPEIDITMEPDDILQLEIQQRGDSQKVLYIHLNGKTVLRACRLNPEFDVGPSDGVLPPILPTVHLNGTSQDALVGQLTNVAGKLREAMEAMQQAAPHGRDYYVSQDPDAYKKARRQWEKRYGRLAALARQIDADCEAIADL